MRPQYAPPLSTISKKNEPWFITVEDWLPDQAQCKNSTEMNRSLCSNYIAQRLERLVCSLWENLAHQWFSMESSVFFRVNRLYHIYSHTSRVFETKQWDLNKRVDLYVSTELDRSEWASNCWFSVKFGGVDLYARSTSRRVYTVRPGGRNSFASNKFVWGYLEFSVLIPDSTVPYCCGIWVSHGEFRPLFLGHYTGGFAKKATSSEWFQDALFVELHFFCNVNCGKNRASVTIGRYEITIPCMMSTSVVP